MFATSLCWPCRSFESFNQRKPGPHGPRLMMGPPSGPESQSHELLDFAVSKHFQHTNNSRIRPVIAVHFALDRYKTR